MEFFDFDDAFLALTGNRRLSWQKRLHAQHFEQGKLDTCSVIDIPTGLGKTMVMAIWLIARAQKANVPTRLIYVVDRRTVVDQATDLAEEFAFLLAREDAKQFQHVAKRKPKLVEQKRKFADTLDGLRHGLGIADMSLAISTLRGQLADNREWSKDPSRPAIIIGTVDLIGSGLLFSGYRSSYKRRPLEAGLLGQDSLLVLDEAHLSKPFDNLLGAIEQFSTRRDGHGAAAGLKPLRVIRMSATSSGNDSNRFKLESSDVDESVVNQRITATKTLRILPSVESKKLDDALASEAINLAENNSLRGKRVVVFVRKPEDAKAVAKTIREHLVESVDESGARPKKAKNTPYASSVEVLTGTMRGLERDEFVEKPVLRRFLNGDEDPNLEANKQPVFLVSTSAGEVGFDLNADHMVCDATTIDSLIQRLGRVNRRGLGEARIHLFAEPRKKEKDGNLKKLEGLDLAIANTIDLLQDVKDVSPKNIAALKADGWKDKYADACSPVPTMVELTDILLDAWSMTSITEPIPGRPEVGPWLRGLAEWEPPQTTIAWRAELDEPGFGDLDFDEMEEWFDTHRVLAHETLSVPTNFAAKQLIARWSSFDAVTKERLGTSRVVVNRAGMEAPSLADFMKSLERDERQTQKTYDTIQFAELILPASFGGIRRGVGLLDYTEPKLDRDDERKPPEEQKTILKDRQDSIDVADVRGRYREKVEKSEDGEVATALDPKTIKPTTDARKYTRYSLDLSSDDDRSVRLFSYVRKREKPETGAKEQPLEDHVKAVRKHADAIIQCLNRAPDDPVRLALQLAADWHDHGKNREFFQRTVGGKRSDGQRPWPDHVMGKSGGRDRGRPVRGYRHEFGSLREFNDAFNVGKLLDDAGKPITQDVFDLAMHLIATHHGRGRPHFPKGGFDPDCERQAEQIHTESIRRFARLQRKYGWWHLAWLENLLRCADALASAEPVAEDDPAGAEGGKL